MKSRIYGAVVMIAAIVALAILAVWDFPLAVRDAKFILDYWLR